MIWWILGGAAALLIGYEVVRVERFIHVYQRGSDYEKTVRVLQTEEALDRATGDVDRL